MLLHKYIIKTFLKTDQKKGSKSVSEKSHRK